MPRARWTFLLAAVLVSACTSHDPRKELEIKDVETYWAVDSSVGDRQYIAPVVRFRLKNPTTSALSSIQVTASFKRKGENQSWGSDFWRSGGRKKLLAQQDVLIVLKSDARYYSAGAPESMFEHTLFKDARVEVFARIAASDWIKVIDAPIERRIGTKSLPVSPP